MFTLTSGAERYLAESGARGLRDASPPPVEARGFSPAKSDECEAPASLPQAAAQDEGPERQTPESGRPAKPIAGTIVSVPLPYQPFPKQRAFHASPAKYRLFGGAAGPGKSKALLMEAILQAHEHPGANTLLLRRTFPELEQSLLLYFRRDVPRELYDNFNESKHVVTWRNGSTTRFGYCQSESDVYQYQGAEFLFIGIDELTLFTLRQWQFLTSRNRCPVRGAFPNMAGATNPGNIGHAWVKSLWIDKTPAPGMENPAEYDPADYDFIPARVGDNPVYAGDEHYLKTLRALPSHLRRAFLDGDWEVFAGQYFDNFDCARHVLRAEQIGFSVGARHAVPGADACLDAAHPSSATAGESGMGAWPSWWPRWISIDWGFEHPAAVYWHCAIPGSSAGARSIVPGADSWRDAAHQPPSPGGIAAVGAQDAVPLQDQNIPRRIVTYREYVTRRATPRDLAREIVRRSLQTTPSVGARHVVPGTDSWRDAAHQPASPDEGSASASNDEDQQQIPRRLEGGLPRSGNEKRKSASAEKIDAIYLSPDAFAHRTGEASIAEQMGDVFAAEGLPRPVPADDDRVGGWMLMYQMLATDEWALTDNCFELIRTLPSLVRDPVRVEDIEKCDGDDPADAARYGLKSRYAAHRGDPAGWRSRMPLADRIAAHAYSGDPTIRAMQSRKFSLEESRGAQPVPFAHRRR